MDDVTPPRRPDPLLDVENNTEKTPQNQPNSIEEPTNSSEPAFIPPEEDRKSVV